jgi:hypothetical protein
MIHLKFQIPKYRFLPSPERLRAGRPNKLKTPILNDRPSPPPSPLRGEGKGKEGLGFRVLEIGIDVGFGVCVE